MLRTTFITVTTVIIKTDLICRAFELTGAKSRLLREELSLRPSMKAPELGASQSARLNARGVWKTIRTMFKRDAHSTDYRRFNFLYFTTVVGWMALTGEL